MLTAHSLPDPRRCAGFSIVELMVGVVIALLGSLIIFQVFGVSESYKRTTTSGGDAQTTGMVALYEIERDVRQAGQGYSDLITHGARLLAAETDEGGGVTPRTYGPLQPITITKNASGTGRDQIEVLTAGPDFFPGHAKFGRDGSYNPAVATPAALAVQTTKGLSAGSLVAICEPGLDCTLRQVSSEVAGGEVPELRFDPGDIVLPNGSVVFGRFNPAVWPATPAPAPRGDPPTITAWAANYQLVNEARVFSLGPPPPPGTFPIRSRLYAVDASNVLGVSDDGGATSEAIAENVLSLQAQYGLDTNAAAPGQPYGDGVVDVFVDPNPANFNLPNHAMFTPANQSARGAAWRRVLAVRVAIVTRGNLQEKEVVTTSSTLTLWPGRTWNVPDQYFRYKVFETIVPVRTMLWARDIN